MTHKILIFNWHEGYIHLLAKTGYQFDVAEVTKGGHYGWIQEFRPVQNNCRLISEIEALSRLEAGLYDMVICQNLDDLTLVYQYPIPKIQVFHTRFSLMTARCTDDEKNQLREKLERLIDVLDNITLVFVSRSKMEEWGGSGKVILPGVDPEEYKGYKGNIEKVLSVGNSVNELNLKYFEERLKGVPFTILGDNTSLSESYLPVNWAEYKSYLQSHRVYMNLLQEGYDDGYNLAMLEAMATGMPVVSIANATSPLINGVNGYISQDDDYLRDRICELFGNLSLAESVGRNGREFIIDKFPINTFIDSWREVIENAQRSNKNISKKDLEASTSIREKGLLDNHPLNLSSRIFPVHYQSYESVFEKNMSIMKEKNPHVAEAVISQKKGDSLEIIYSRNNLPSLRTRNTTLHSLYDPENEAKAWVRHYKETIRDASLLFVFGFGLGYHLLELCKTSDKEIRVFEPRVDILRVALKTVDLTSILSKIKILMDGGVKLCESKVAILEHKPSVRLNRDFFEDVKTKLRSLEFIRKGLKILVVGPIYGGSLPIARYCSYSLRKMGHTVEFIDNSQFDNVLMYVKDIAANKTRYQQLLNALYNFLSETVIARCEACKPDLVFALAQAPLSTDCLERLRRQGIPTAFWFVEDFRFMDYWKRSAKYYDYFFTIQKDELYRELEKEGIKNYHYLPTAACPDIHRPSELTVEEKNYYGSDISFVGAGYYNRRHFFKGLLDFDFKIWGTDWDMHSALAGCIQRSGARIDTEEIVKIFSAAKININLHSSTYHKGVNPFGDFVNPRMFEIIGCGGFQLVDRRSGLEGMFEENEEIVLFDDLDDLRNKITYYLNNPEERGRIAERGRQRVLREHTYINRMQEMLEFIVEKGYQPPVRSEEGEDVQSLIEEAGEDTGLGKYLSQFSKKGKVDIYDIAEKIKAGEGDISKTETLFLLMNEFVS